MRKLREAEHLFRLAVVFIVGAALFAIVHRLLVPSSFGRYGHFRADAIVEIASRPVSFAGHQTCETCHSDVLEVKTKGKHARIACESCHDALSSHADDPSIQPKKLDAAVLCAGCHEASTAKPNWFPQVVSEEHSSGIVCTTCHQPHNPVIEVQNK